MLNLELCLQIQLCMIQISHPSGDGEFRVLLRTNEKQMINNGWEAEQVCAGAAQLTVGFKCNSELCHPLIPEVTAGATELGPAQAPQRPLSTTGVTALYIEH